MASAAILWSRSLKMLNTTDEFGISYRAQRVCALAGVVFVGLISMGATLFSGRAEAAGCRHYAVIGHWQGPIADRGVPPDAGVESLNSASFSSSAPGSSLPGSSSPGSDDASDCHGPNCTKQVPILPQQTLRIVLVQSFETYLLAALEMPEYFSCTPLALRDVTLPQRRPVDLLRPPR